MCPKGIFLSLKDMKGHVKQAITMADGKGQVEMVCKWKNLQTEKIAIVVNIINTLRSL